MEVNDSRSRVSISSVFALCNQPGFRSRRNLYKVSIMVLRNHLGLLMILNVCCFQGFQLTALVVRGPPELHPIFTVPLNGVAIDHEKVKGAVACVLDFVRQPLFKQKNFFCETRISMLNTAVAAVVAVQHSSKFDAWRAIGVDIGSVIADLNSCREKVLPRRKTVKDTRERWFVADTVAPSAVSAAATRTTVRKPDAVEVRDFQYINEQHKHALPFCSLPTPSPGRRQKRRVPLSLVVLRMSFSVASPSASHPSIEAAPEKSFEKLGARRSCRDPRNVPVLPGRYK